MSRHEEGVRDLAIWDVLIAYVPVSGLSMSGEWLHVVSAASIFPMFGLLMIRGFPIDCEIYRHMCEAHVSNLMAWVQ